MAEPTTNWTPEEDAALRLYWPDPLVTMPEIGRRVGRSTGAVKCRGHKALKLGPKAIDRAANNRRHGYSEEMRGAVGRLRLQGFGIAEIAEELGTGISFVTKNLRAQGIRKPRASRGRIAVEQAPRPVRRRPAFKPVEPRVVQLRPITPAVIARAHQQIARGVTVEDFADLFDVSLEGLSAALNPVEVAA